MQISKINSALAFKSCNHCEDSNQQNTKLSTSNFIEKGVKATAVGTAAIPTGLLIGTKGADTIEKYAVQFCNDFATKADDAAKVVKEQVSGTGIKKLLNRAKNITIEAITELPKKTKATMKWGIAGIATAVLTYLGTKDEDKDGKSDLIEAVKKFANPA